MEANNYCQSGDRFALSLDRQKALAAYGSAIKLNPSLYGAHLGRGRIFMQTGRYREATEEFMAALAI